MEEFKIKIPSLDTPSVLYSYHTSVPIFKGSEEDNNHVGECTILLKDGKHYGEIKLSEKIDLNWKFLIICKPVEDVRRNIHAISLRPPSEENKHIFALKDCLIQ